MMVEYNPRFVAAAEANDVVAQIIRARRLRGDIFRQELFSDPAWDILLALFQARLRQQGTSISELAGSVAISSTTLDRWLDALNADGLVVQAPDPSDPSQTLVELSARGSGAMERWIEQCLEGRTDTNRSRLTDLLTRLHDYTR